jgi:hypothetical protein
MERLFNILLASSMFFAIKSYGEASSSSAIGTERTDLDDMYYLCMELWTQIDLIRASTTSTDAKREAAVQLCDRTIDLFGKVIVALKLDLAEPKDIEKLKRISFKLKHAYDNTFTADHGEHACAIFVLLAKIEELLFKKSFSYKQGLNTSSTVQHPTDLLSCWY